MSVSFIRRRNRAARRNVLAGVVLASLGLCPAAVHAQTTWTNNNGTGDSEWNTATNWTNLVPVASAAAFFENREIENISITGTPANVLNMLFSNAAGGYRFSGNSLTINDTNPFALTSAAGGGFAQFNNQVLFANSGLAVAINRGTVNYTNTNSGAQNNFNGATFTVASPAMLRGSSGTAPTQNSLGNSTANLSGGSLRLDGTTANMVAGMFAREYIGANYTNATPAGLGSASFTTNAPWDSATSTQLIYSNLAAAITDSGAFVTARPGSGFGNNVTGGSNTFGRFLAPTTGYYTFQSNSDDGTRMFIDGVAVNVHDNGHGASNNRSISVFLTAGYHDAEFQWINSGSQGSWDYSFIAPGLTAATNFNGSMFVSNSGASAAPTAADFSTTNVNVSGANSGLVVNLPGVVPQVNVGNLNFLADSTFAITTTTPSNRSTVNVSGLGGTTFADGAQTINVAENLVLNVGTANGGGTNAVITKTGPGTLAFDNSSTANGLAAGSLIDVQQGVMHVTGSSAAGATNPYGAANLRLSGGTLRLDTKFGNPANFTGTIDITASSKIEAVATNTTSTLTGNVTLAPSTTLTLDPKYGNLNSGATTAGATISFTGNLTGNATTSVLVSSPIYSIGNGGVLTPTASGFGTVLLNADSPSFAGTITIDQANLQAFGTAGAASTALGTGTVNLAYGRLFLKNNGTGANTQVLYNNPVNITRGLGANFDVNSVGAVANLGFRVPSLGLDAAANPQKFVSLNVTGANSASLNVDSTVTLTGDTLLDPTTAQLRLLGGISGNANSSLTKTGASTLVIGGTSTTNNVGAGTTLVATAGTVQVGGAFSSGTSSNLTGTAAQLTNNVLAINPTTIIADNNTTATTSAFTGSVTLRNGAIFRLDQNDAVLPQAGLSTTPVNSAPAAGILALNTATFSQDLVYNATGLFLGTGQGTVTYTGAPIPAINGSYLVGGGTAASQTLVLQGNGSAVLTGGNSLTVGSPYIRSAGGFAGTVRLPNAAAQNTFTGGTTINTGFTLDVQTGGSKTPLGSGEVQVFGTLAFTGANGTALSTSAGINNNNFRFYPGSALFFGDLTGNGNAYAGGNGTTLTDGRWADATAIPMDSTTLTIRGLSAATAQGETVGDVTFNGGSVAVVNKNGTAGGNVALTVASLTRTGAGTLRISVPAGETNAVLNTGSTQFVVAGASPTEIGGGGSGTTIVPAYVTTTGAGTSGTQFVTKNGSNQLVPATYSSNGINAGTATDVVNVTAATTVTANPTITALRVGAVNLTATAGTGHTIAFGTLGGGIIFDGTSTHTTGFDFGAREAVINVPTGTATLTVTNTGTAGTLLTGGIIGSGGLTKYGTGTLNLSTAATGTTAAAFSGPVTINEGSLQLTSFAGGTTVPMTTTSSTLTMNGGTLTLRRDSAATYFNNVVLRNSAAYDINRSNTTATNINLTLGGTFTVGDTGGNNPLVGTFPITFTGAAGNSYNLNVGDTTLNQDLILNNGRLRFTGTITGNGVGGRSITLTNGANAFFTNTARTGLSNITVQNGTIVPETAATYALGAPVTMYGGGFFASAAATLTDSFQIYSGISFSGGSNMTLLDTSAKTVTLGVATQAGPLVFNTANSSGTAGNITTTTLGSTTVGANVYGTSLTVQASANGNGTSARHLVLNEGSGATVGTWDLSGPIELSNNGQANGVTGLRMVVQPGANPGDEAPVVANVTTLRANGGNSSNLNAFHTFAFTGNDVSNSSKVARVVFDQTILDGNLNIDAVDGTASTSNLARVSLGNIVVNGDRILNLNDGVNNLSTEVGVDFTGITGAVGSNLRLSTSVTTAGLATLNTDVSATMLGTVTLSNLTGNAAAFWTMTSTGALGAQGIVNPGIRLSIPGTTTLTAKDSIYSTGLLAGAGLNQLVLDGPASGPRVSLGSAGLSGSGFLHAADGGLAATNGVGVTTTLPSGIGGLGTRVAPISAAQELRLAANINQTSNFTVGGNSGIGLLSNDGSTRTITSGTITVGGSFILGTRGGNLVLGGTAAGNRKVDLVADPESLTGYKGDAILNNFGAAASTILFGNNGTGGEAGDLSGLRRVLVSSGQANQPMTVQGQISGGLGGTGTTKPNFYTLMGANATLNSLDPGPAALIVGGTAAFTNTSPITGNAYIDFNGRLLLNDATNLTNNNSGTFNMRTGSFIDITNAGALSATAGQVPTFNLQPGVIVNAQANNPNSFASLINEQSVIRINGNRTLDLPITLNRDPATPLSGALMTSAAATFTSSGGVTVGTNGAIFAATGGALTYGGTLTTNGNPVQVGNIVNFTDNVTVANAHNQQAFIYTGTSNFNTSAITIVGGATLQTPAASVSNTNNLIIDGRLNNATAGAAMTVGSVTSNGLASLSTSVSGTGSSITAASLIRVNNGGFALLPTASTLGSTQKVFVSGTVPAAAGSSSLGSADAFAAPYIFNATDGRYVNYDATNGFTNQNGVAYATATGTQVAEVTGNLAVAAGGATKGALFINLTAGAVTVSGGTLTLTSGGVLSNSVTAGNTISAPLNMNGQEAVFTVTGGNVLTLSSQVSNTNGVFTKLGGNSMQVTAAQTNLGTSPTINVLQGNLRVNVANAFPTDSIVYVGGQGNFDLFNFSQTIAGLTGTGTVANTQTTSAATQTLTINTPTATNYTFDGMVSQASTSAINLIKNGTGTQSFTNNATSDLAAVTVNDGTLNFGGTVTFGGIATVNGGTMNIARSGWLNGVNMTGGTLNMTGNSYVFGNNGSMTLSGNAVANLGGTNTENVNITGNLSVSGNASLNLNANASYYILGTTTMSQAGNVVLTGNGNTFHGAATFTNTGSITLNGTNTFNNTFDASSSNVSQVSMAANSTTVFNGPATLKAGAIDSTAQFQFSNTLNLLAGTLNVSSTNALRGNVGTVTLGSDAANTSNVFLQTSAPDVTIARPIATGTGNAIYTIGSSATSGNATYSGPVTLNSTLHVSAAAGGTVQLTGAIASANGQFGLTKVGNGTANITGNTNTFTGGILVDAGTLTVNNTSGSATGSGAVVVSRNATLGGAGTIAGPAFVDGRVSPGNSIGTLTVGSNVTWNANAGNAWAWELGASGVSIASPGTSDLLNITAGNFVKGTGSAFTFDFMGTGAAGVYKLVDWTGTTNFVASDFVASNLTGGLTSSFTVDNATSALYLTLNTPGGGATPTTYTLAAAPSTINLLKGGTLAATSTITNTGTGTADTLSYTGLTATSADPTKATVTGTSGSGTLNNSSAMSGMSAVQNLTVTGINNGSTTITAAVAPTPQNSTLMSDATLSGTPGSINVVVGNASFSTLGNTRVYGDAPQLATLASNVNYANANWSSNTNGLTASVGGPVAAASTATILNYNNTTGSTETVSMQWRTRTATEANANQTNAVLSDIVNLTGMLSGSETASTGTGIFVLQMSYLQSTLDAYGLNESAIATSGELRLGWNDNGVWKTAGLGNVGPGGGVATFVGAVAYDPMNPAHNMLGAYGVNPAGDGGVVWAVLNHNSEFAVIPEPSTLVLGGLGLLSLAGVGLRRRRLAKQA